MANGMTTSKYRLIWQLMEGERLRYLAAIAALVVASCFLYLVPLVPAIVLDGIITPDSQTASPLVSRAVEIGGGRDFLRQNLWIAVVLVITLTGVAGGITYLRGRWSALATERIVRGVR